MQPGKYAIRTQHLGDSVSVRSIFKAAMGFLAALVMVLGIAGAPAQASEPSEFGAQSVVITDLGTAGGSVALRSGECPPIKSVLTRKGRSLPGLDTPYFVVKAKTVSEVCYTTDGPVVVSQKGSAGIALRNDDGVRFKPKCGDGFGTTYNYMSADPAFGDGWNPTEVKIPCRETKKFVWGTLGTRRNFELPPLKESTLRVKVKIDRWGPNHSTTLEGAWRK